MVNTKLLKTGGIYRISYANWITNERPIVYVIWSGPLKLHGISLNSRSLSSLDIIRFVNYIKNSKKILGFYKYSGRILYRIIRGYYGDLIRKGYRTYRQSAIVGFSLVNYGTTPKEYYTQFEMAHNSQYLYNQSKWDPTLQRINWTNRGSAFVPPKKPIIYNPQTPKIIKKEEDNGNTTTK